MEKEVRKFIVVRMADSMEFITFIEPEEEWNVFISYASKDRESVAAPLANALCNKGLSVWFDQFEIKVRDSLFSSISEGIKLSMWRELAGSCDWYWLRYSASR